MEFCKNSNNMCDEMMNNDKCMSIPCSNIKLKIKQIKPIHLCKDKSLFLQVELKDCCNSKNRATITVEPKQGCIRCVHDGIYVYTPHKDACGYDFFQISVEDKCGKKGFKGVLVCIQDCDCDCK